jgi:nitrogen-specific signal transduction histidine kinase
MMEDLERNRKIMYQKQRLEAWKEMARRVVHEIKNPSPPFGFRGKDAQAVHGKEP